MDLLKELLGQRFMLVQPSIPNYLLKKSPVSSQVLPIYITKYNPKSFIIKTFYHYLKTPPFFL